MGMEIDYAKVLRDNLRDMMKQCGCTQNWLANRTGIPEATISRYLAGIHNPKIDYVAKMATAMGVSIDYLLGLSLSSEPNRPPREEIRTLVAGYGRADAHTKKMVWMQMELILTEEEQERWPQWLAEPRTWAAETSETEVPDEHPEEAWE